MKKVTVTLRDSPTASVEVPVEFPREKRKKKSDDRRIERSVIGAIRLFPGVPKAISADELEFVRLHRPSVFARLDSRPYVESKRVDYRGASEGEVEDLAAKEGIGHLEFWSQVAVLRERGKIKRPDPKRSTETRYPGPTPASDEGGKTTTRKPK
jgi:hypothetical protein